ncbi:MAG: PH domain-containing protein [Pseudomonadota bacterium]
MAVTTKDGVTVLKPTAWKWFAGALAIFFMLPGFGWIIAGVFGLMGAGVLQNLSLTPQGLKVRNWFTTKEYAWADISDFRVYKVRSGLITAASMVSFTQAKKDGSMMGNAAKFLVGGTDTIPAVGMPAKKLIHVMEAYKRGFIPADSEAPEASLPPSLPVFTPPATPKPAPVKREKARPRAVPATPRAQNRPATKQPNLGGTHKTSTPLVQEGGGLFGRRRSSSPFQS